MIIFSLEGCCSFVVSYPPKCALVFGYYSYILLSIAYVITISKEKANLLADYTKIPYVKIKI